MLHPSSPSPVWPGSAKWLRVLLRSQAWRAVDCHKGEQVHGPVDSLAPEDVPKPRSTGEGMACLLQGSPYVEYRWHSWRGAGRSYAGVASRGGFYVGGGGGPACAWPSGTRQPPTTSSSTVCLASHGPRPPDSSGFKWAPVSVADFWPRSLANLYVLNEKRECILSMGEKILS